jgi:uncharacterized protein (DUF2267 family)
MWGDMDSELLIERVTRWGGIASSRDAEKAILATLSALRDALFSDEAKTLAEELPDGLGKPLRMDASVPILEADELYHRAARYENVPVRVALEHVQTVCQALASLLSPALLARMNAALPNFPELFVVPDRSSHPALTHRAQARTLAEGRPGSRHPLAEARPGSGHPLSEAAPPTLDATTIAEGRPGSEHPLSEARYGSEHSLSEARPPARGR